MRRFLPFALSALVLIAAAVPGQALAARRPGRWQSPATSDFNGDGVQDQAIGVPNEDVSFGGGSVEAAGAVSILYGQASGRSAGHEPRRPPPDPGRSHRG
jgi:hypothetical protein